MDQRGDNFPETGGSSRATGDVTPLPAYVLPWPTCRQVMVTSAALSGILLD
jgi:hypothetical protein